MWYIRKALSLGRGSSEGNKPHHRANGRERTKPIKPNRAPKKAEELAGGEGRQQIGPETKANTVPKRGGREGKA